MKRAAFAVAILLSASANLAQAQSLKETTDWLHDFMQAEGSLLSVDGNWHDRYQVVADGCKVTVLHDTQDISCTKPKNKDACSHLPPTTIYHFKQVFNLKDIDLSRIMVDSNPSFHADSVNLTTMNELPLVANDEDHGTLATLLPTLDDLHHVYAVLPNPEAAKRTAKAFQRAVELCGGKASPF